MLNMKSILIVAAAFGFVLTPGFAAGATCPDVCGCESARQPSLVSVLGRQVFVQRRLSDNSLDRPRAYRMRGVNWAPASIGSSVADRQNQYAAWFETDLPLIASMNANTIRVFLGFGIGSTACAILDRIHALGLMVVVTVDLMVNDTG